MAAGRAAGRAAGLLRGGGAAVVAGAALVAGALLPPGAAPPPDVEVAAATPGPAATAAAAGPEDLLTAPAGNPFVDGWYADPDVLLDDGTYWVFPTTSAPYDDQTVLDAFSSTDLVHWTKHPGVLDLDDVSWGRRALWAPSPVERDGRYYLYFAANDIQSDDEVGGIGVAVADRPEGPYSDALGEPLVDAFHNGAQPIDQDVFVDDDGEAYMYYGGHGHANVVRLGRDMTSVVPFDDGTTYREITPSEDYVEGSQMVKRGDTYYYMWSEGGWTGPDYAVAYATSDSALGPFGEPTRVLQQDPAVARGAGHNGVVNVPGTDTWFLFYHRRPLGETDQNARVLAYDRLTFDADGRMEPVTMRVQDDFSDGNTLGWDTEGGLWAAQRGRLEATAPDGGRAVLDTRFSEVVAEARVRVRSRDGDAGLLVRVTRQGSQVLDGYYAGVSGAGQVFLRSSEGGEWTELASARLRGALARDHRLRVEAVGSSVRVFVGDGTTPVLEVDDDRHRSGATGLRAVGRADLDDVVVAAAPPSTTEVSVYGDCEMGALLDTYGPGDHTAVPDDEISSLRVPEGYRITLFDGPDQTGESLVKTEDDPCLVDDGWNDRTSSFRVEGPAGR
ncbi:family 43 glycosylhydrolase [Pseudokineococcus lusitanus]|uniref:family 43 glycosylhydrolase n=1 Tax=Pseudokineococcus lusitanus TaxID=763993 RepID=UPI0018F40290|nr:family 43 glycosylhydrolase [Pseudokineococcus lusitanus]